ncbi:MAG: tetratricopeptide repeat protein, partial [Candidatus Binatia bacterium]
MGEQALALGDFAEVISESQRALASEESRVPSDAALFTLGMVYAHPQNPAKNSTEAMRFFTQLVNEHPHSPWSTQARVWLALLKEQENLAESNTKLQEENTALDRFNKKLKDEQESLIQAQK